MRLTRARSLWAAPALLLPLSALAVDPSGDSPRTTFVEFKFGAYKPAVDSQFSGDPRVRPYQRIFGDETANMLNLTLERHILQDVGTLSLGFGIGYWSIEGQGISEGAEDTTSMTLVPVSVQLSYRLDIWQRIVPLVPMVRAGLDYVWWRIFDGEGNVTRFAPGKSAEGGTFGWHMAGGLLLALDFFDPPMAADFDRNAGVNSSYLFVELQRSQVDDFGRRGSIRLGNTTMFLGIALDM